MTTTITASANRIRSTRTKALRFLRWNAGVAGLFVGVAAALLIGGGWVTHNQSLTVTRHTGTVVSTDAQWHVYKCGKALCTYTDFPTRVALGDQTVEVTYDDRVSVGQSATVFETNGDNFHAYSPTSWSTYAKIALASLVAGALLGIGTTWLLDTLL